MRSSIGEEISIIQSQKEKYEKNVIIPLFISFFTVRYIRNIPILGIIILKGMVSFLIRKRYLEVYEVPT